MTFTFIETLGKWLFSLDRNKKRLIQICLDFALVFVSLSLALLVRLENLDFFRDIDVYFALLILLTATMLVFVIRGQYNVFVRYSSFETIVTIVVATSLASSILALSIIFLGLKLPLSTPVIYATLLCFFAAATRFFVRILSSATNHRNRKKVAIYGAGVAGSQLTEALKWNPDYQVSLIIDDASDLQGQKIGGVPIDSFDSALTKLERMKIRTLFLAITKRNNTINDRVLDLLSKHTIEVKIVPSISKLISNINSEFDIQTLRIEDLLERETVKHHHNLMAKNLTGKTVLVTGAGGSIGSELCRQIIQWAPKKLLLVDVSEYAIYTVIRELEDRLTNKDVELFPIVGSIQDELLLSLLFKKFEVNTVYHAAAYKHVPLMEQNVMQCFTNNFIGTLTLAHKAVEAGVPNFILISTDKAVNPTNFMGVSKRLSEIACQSFSGEENATNFAIVRFGNVLGSSGSVVPLFEKQIKDGGPVTITHRDATRFFMTIPEAAQLVIQAGSLSKGGDVFVLDMGDPIRVLDLAKKMIRLSGLQPADDADDNIETNDIQITEIGLRTGEKLHEELSYNEELVPTEHPRIMTTLETKESNQKLNALSDGIIKAITEGDRKSLEQLVCKAVGHFPNANAPSDIFLN